MKGLPSGYNKDLQEDKEAVFDAEATLAASLRAAHAVVVAADRSTRERAGRAASGLLLATDVADYLVVARHAVPARPRSRRRHGAAAAGRGARLQRPDAATNGATRARCSARTRRGRPPRWPRCRRGGRRSPPIRRRSSAALGECRALARAVGRPCPGIAVGLAELTLLHCRSTCARFHASHLKGIGSGGVHAATPASAR